MKDVPKMLSPKDLTYLSDAFNWNFIMAKKCFNYKNIASNKEVIEALDNTYKLHKNICNKIVDIVEGEINE